MNSILRIQINTPRDQLARKWSVMSFTLPRSPVRLDEQLSTQVFNASFEAHLSRAGSNPTRALGDPIQICQFHSGNGIVAFCDAL